MDDSDVERRAQQQLGRRPSDWRNLPPRSETLSPSRLATTSHLDISISPPSSSSPSPLTLTSHPVTTPPHSIQVPLLLSPVQDTGHCGRLFFPFFIPFFLFPPFPLRIVARSPIQSPRRCAFDCPFISYIPPPPPQNPFPDFFFLKKNPERHLQGPLAEATLVHKAASRIYQAPQPLHTHRATHLHAWLLLECCACRACRACRARFPCVR